LAIDKSFYNYKQEAKAQIEQLKAEKEQSEKELNDLNEELEATKKKIGRY
jgi:cell division protein FtsB